MSTSAIPERVTSASRRRARSRAFAVTAAVLTALVVWSVMVPLLGVELKVRMSPGGSSVQTVGVTSVLAVSLLASLLGWGLLARLERHNPRAGIIWTITAGVVLLLSLGGPLTGAVTTGAKVALALLHLSVAAVLIPLLRRSSPTRLIAPSPHLRGEEE